MKTTKNVAVLASFLIQVFPSFGAVVPLDVPELAANAAESNVRAHAALSSTVNSNDGRIQTAGEGAGSTASIQCTSVHPSCTETADECRCCIDAGELVAFEYCAYWTPCTGQSACVWASALPSGATFPQRSGVCEACSTFWWIPLQPGSYTAILKGGEFCGVAQVSETIRFTVVNPGGCCSDDDCGDANVCTTDRCTAGACTHTPNTSPCNDGVFCNGPDTCRDGTCSVHSSNPCLGRPECADTCNEAADNCFDPAGTQCSDDGNACTSDTCNGNGACAHPHKSQGIACNDGLFCNGSDNCDGAGTCVHSGDPCLGEYECADACNESAENCFDPAGAACGDASDSGCDASDTCDGEGACLDRKDAAGTSCDDGLFCNGPDNCDGAGVCVRAGNPCLGGPECADSCNEAVRNCFDPPGAACGDASDIGCDGPDTCDGVGTCVDRKDVAGTSCDDGLFCNGMDTCSGGGACTHSGNPCVDEEHCSEVAGKCICLFDHECNDRLDCTTDTCDARGWCKNEPAAGWCVIAGTCYADAVLNPANECERCDTQADLRAWTPFPLDAPCGDHSDTDCDDPDACDGAGRCRTNHKPPGTPCGDAFDTECDAPDTCDGGGNCLANHEPQGTSCGDGTDTQCDNPDNCDGGGSCLKNHEPSTRTCDDGLFCNGVDTCRDGQCQSGGNPCAAQGLACDEANDSCRCNDDADCDDGRFCNGNEVCHPVAGCQTGPPPDCNDGVPCTIDSCNQAADSCDHVADDIACDDQRFCNGVEFCDSVGGCRAGTPPDCNDNVGCTVDSCDETNDGCDHLPHDADCDDALFCNGVEVCDSVNDCQAGAPPNCDDGIDCTLDSCDEAQQACAHSAVDNDCDDGVFCNGFEQCDSMNGCVPGEPPNCDDGVASNVDRCDAINDECKHGELVIQGATTVIVGASETYACAIVFGDGTWEEPGSRTEWRVLSGEDLGVVSGAAAITPDGVLTPRADLYGTVIPRGDHTITINVEARVREQSTDLVAIQPVLILPGEPEPSSPGLDRGPACGPCGAFDFATSSLLFLGLLGLRSNASRAVFKH